MGLALGQLSLLATAAVLAALRAQGTGHARRAGFWLALATAKVHTMLPFLLLFLRKRDRATWASFLLVSLGLVLASGRPAELPGRVLSTLETIRVTFEPGRVNDYGFAGPSHASLVGLDHALYRVGIRDRDLIGAARVGLLALLGFGLAWTIATGRSARGVLCALVASYAAVFLYHRILRHDDPGPAADLRRDDGSGRWPVAAPARRRRNGLPAGAVRQPGVAPGRRRVVVRRRNLGSDRSRRGSADGDLARLDRVGLTVAGRWSGRTMLVTCKRAHAPMSPAPARPGLCLRE